MAEIRIENLSKSYEKELVLSDISLSVPDGGFEVLLGPSGSGKTTLLHCIAGILTPDSGSVLFDGSPVDNLPIHKRNAVLVDQSVTLFPHMTARQNIEFGLLMHKLPKEEIKKQVADMIKLVELEGFEDRFPAELSGGQMQRVALARALVLKPNVLLLDEPFSRLDITLRASLRAFVRKLVSKTGTTTIMVTHDAEEALSMADNISLLLDNRIVQSGAPDEVYKHPKSRAASEFFGVRNYIESDGKTYVLRPEEISLEVPSDKNGGCPKGTVTSRSYTGELYRYEVASGDMTYCSSMMSDTKFSVGDEVSLVFSLDGAAALSE
ncbi:MAG: ABC transporter ATP-binding protein [Clostridiales bacterium]|nr:ABC transporter ATP-binding protein [Clostridiales bacterium]